MYSISFTRLTNGLGRSNRRCKRADEPRILFDLRFHNRSNVCKLHVAFGHVLALIGRRILAKNAVHIVHTNAPIHISFSESPGTELPNRLINHINAFYCD